MTEWGVVGVIVALVGLVAAIVGPMTNLTRSITKLTVMVERLEEDIRVQRSSAKASHQRLWAKCTEQDELLSDHEHRITVLEEHKEG